MHLRCSDSVREIMKFLKRKYLDRAGVLRDVEKLHFLQNSKNLGDRKCLGKLRKSFVEHPDTILFSRISRERVFQHPRLFTSTIPSGDFKTSFPRRIALVCYSCGRFHLSRKDCAKRVAAIPGEPASRQLSEFVPIRFDCGARF